MENDKYFYTMSDNFLKQYGFDVKDELCPLIWDESKKLKEDVSKVVKQNVVEFLKFMKIPLKPKDVILVGSLAGYNWSKFSDVDVHVLVDIDEMGYDKELIAEFFDAKKSIWNEKTDAKIKGFDIEFYIQDVNEENASQGIYSIVSDKWLQSPSKVKEEIDESALKKKVEFLQKEIDNSVEGDCDVDCLNSLRKKIRKMRKSGLQERGEFSIENLAFKALRRNEYIEKLIKKSNELRDKELSLESIMDDAFLMKENYGFYSNKDINNISKIMFDKIVGFFKSIDKKHLFDFLFEVLDNDKDVEKRFNDIFSVDGKLNINSPMRFEYMGEDIIINLAFNTDNNPYSKAITYVRYEKIDNNLNYSDFPLGCVVFIDKEHIIHDFINSVTNLKSILIHEAGHIFKNIKMKINNSKLHDSKTMGKVLNNINNDEKLQYTHSDELMAYLSTITTEMEDAILNGVSFKEFLSTNYYWNVLKKHISNNTKKKLLSKLIQYWNESII